MRQQALHDTYVTDNRLVITQTEVEIVSNSQQDEHQHAQPERPLPITPQEGIILHILGTEELLSVKGVHLDGQHLQRKTLALVGLAVNLHRHRRDIIERIIERGHRIDHRTRHEAIVLRLLFEFLPVEYLHTRGDVLHRFELWELHLRILLGRSCQRHMCLLSDKDLDRVNNSLYRYLCRRSQHARCQYDT